MRSSTSAPASPNMMVVCHARKQKLSRFNIASWNGSCAIQSNQALAYVSAVVAVTSTQASWCHSARKPADTYGCIRIVGQHGTPRARQKLWPLSTL